MLDALDGRDVWLAGESNARLIIYCGPIDESPYSGCDNDVRIIPPSEGKQSARLKVLGAIKRLVQDDDSNENETEREPERTYAEAVRDG